MKHGIGNDPERACPGGCSSWGSRSTYLAVLPILGTTSDHRGGAGGFPGSAEGAERAIVADLAERGARGRAFGLYYGLTGAAALPAGLATGWLWDRWGAVWALGLNAVCAAVGAIWLFALSFVGPLRRTAV